MVNKGKFFYENFKYDVSALDCLIQDAIRSSRPDPDQRDHLLVLLVNLEEADIPREGTKGKSHLRRIMRAKEK
jgi:hypothetical protein